MTTILPSARSGLDVVGAQIGANLHQVLPGAVQQGYQRQLGMNALQQAEQDIAAAGNDPYKIALAFAKAGAQNPNLERSLGPLMQTAMTQAKLKNAFPNAPGTGIPNTGVVGQQPQPLPGFMQPQGQPQAQIPAMKFEEGITPQAQPSTFATPSPFNIMTANDIDAESQRYANALNDPNAYSTRQAQLQNQNTIASEQRKDLEDFALKSGISPSELPRFMNVGSKFDTRNPSEWAEKTKRAYQEVKSNDKKLQKAFIPGLGSALLGENRDEALKRMGPTVRDQVKLGQEQETREFLANNYVTPTEISELIHPITPKQEKSIQSLPRGLFPAEKKQERDVFGIPKKKEFVSYEEALEKKPEYIKKLNDNLTEFFLNNVDDDTALLPLREKIWSDKDYDWRQFGPAIREAEKRGLKLNKAQSTEMADIETQPPYQSLPDIFKSMDRVIKYYKGAK